MTYGGRRALDYTAAVLNLYGRTCHLCGRPGADTADHVVPRSKGGAVFDLANGRPAHKRCNSKRGAMDLPEWFARYPLPVATPAPLPPSRNW